MANRSNFPDRAQARRNAAADRREERAERSDSEQLEKLRDEGHGNCKEAARLAASQSQE